MADRRLERFSSMTVLVVDDNATNLALLRALLKMEGLQHVVTETDPREIAELLPRVRPDLVLLDWHMPHLDGLVVLDEIKRYAAGNYLPVLVLTADTTSTARNRALEEGAQDFLTKPLDTTEVALRVANLLHTRQLYSLLRAGIAGAGAAETNDDPITSQGMRSSVQELLSAGGIVPFYQPIFDIKTDQPVGYEALARFPDPHPRGVAGWFSDAFAVGLGTDLEWLAVSKALPFLRAGPADTYLALNMSPATVLTLPERRPFDAQDCPRIVIELTEHVPIEDYSAVHRALSDIRSHGARLAADDLGSGYAGFRHLIALQPDIIKLDISLVRGIHRNRPQRALARALIAFASDVDAQVVAEGVEEIEELTTLQELGVPWAQGYYLGVPKPFEPALLAS